MPEITRSANYASPMDISPPMSPSVHATGSLRERLTESTRKATGYEPYGWQLEMDVKAAIHEFCPFDPRTGDIVVKKSVPSLRLLTRILYLPDYPQLVPLLATPSFVTKCLMDIEEYLQDHKIFDQAYGLLMLKILSLGTMAGVLAQMDQLDSFTRSVLRTKVEGQDMLNVTADLVSRVVSILQDETKTPKGFLDLPIWNYEYRVAIDGQRKRERCFIAERSRLLLDSLWDQRDLMVTTFARSSTPGFSVVLLLISSFELKCNLSREQVQHLTPRSQDLIVRYTFVAPPEENTLLQGRCLPDGTHHLAPVNLNDHRATVKLLIRQLSLSSNHTNSFSVSHAAFMLHQFRDVVHDKKTYEFCVPVMEAGLKFFWRVFSLPENPQECWNESEPSALGPLILFKELLVATSASEDARSLAPAALSVLYRADFVDWCGRLMLLPLLLWSNIVSRGLDADKVQNKKEETAFKMLSTILYLSSQIALYPQFLRLKDRESFNSWVKIYGLGYGLLCSVEPNTRMYPYIRKFVHVWIMLGESFDYHAELEKHRERERCLYA